MRRILLLITLAAAFLMLFMISAEGSDAAVGDRVTYEDMEFTVIAEGTPNEVELTQVDRFSGDLELPDTFTVDETDYMLVSIDFDAIGTDVTFSTITIPAHVRSIDEGAFRCCLGLSTFIVSTSNTYYMSETDGTLYTFDKTVLVAHPQGNKTNSFAFFGTRIASYALYNHRSLEEIVLSPETATLESIGDYGLSGCVKLTKINGLMTKLTYLGAYAFADTGFRTFSIPEKVAAIPDYCFQSCNYLKSITFESYENVISIGVGAFVGLESLVSISSVYTPPVGEKEIKEDALPKTVTSIGNRAFYQCTNLRGLVLPSAVKTIGDRAFYECGKMTINQLPYNLLSIGDYSFYKCNGLKEVTLGPNMTSVGSYAFYQCESVETVGISFALASIGEKVFAECTSLKTLTLGSGLKTISSGMFYGCRSLSAIDIPDSVTSIGDSAFYSCSGASYLHLPSSLKTAGNSAFAYCSMVSTVDIPGSLTTVSPRMFYECKGLSIVTVGSGVHIIGTEAFRGCSILKDLTLPDSVTTIYDSAFRDDAIIDLIVFPENLISIYEYAFYGCSSLGNITLNDKVETIGNYAFALNTSAAGFLYLPSTLITIGDHAFYGCSALTEVTIPKGVDNLGDHVFSECTSLTIAFFTKGLTNVSNYAFYGCQSLDEVYLFEGMLSIGDHAFDGCSVLQEIPLPGTLTSIGSYAFSDCLSLATADIPASVSAVRSYTFSGCLLLSKVTFCVDGSKGVSDIGEYAFSHCESLSDLSLPSTLTAIGKYAFDSCESLITVTIPKSVSFIDNYSFRGCVNLTAYSVSDENTVYASADGVLMIKDLTSLIAYPIGRTSSEYVVPETVVGVGDCAFYRAVHLRSVTLPNSLKTVGDHSFYECKLLSSISIPSGVTSVGDYAFCGCSSMKSVSLGVSLVSMGASAFESCDYIESVYMPDTLSYLGASAFAYCYSLEDVRVSPQITVINENTFTYCTGLRSISLPSGIKTIGDYAFTSCTALKDISLPSELTKIGEYAFSACISIKTITIPSGLTDVTSTSFALCASLERIDVAAGSTMFSSYDGVLFSYDKRTLIKYPSAKTETSYSVPSIVRTIGNTAFLDAANLKSVSIAAGVQKIGRNTFEGCIGLTSIFIPSTVTDIGSNAFKNCTSLTSFTVDPGNTAYTSKDDVLLTYDLSTLIKYPSANIRTTYVTPSVNAIEPYAFESCNNLTSVLISASVTEIRDYAFRGCGSLAQVTMSDGLIRIGQYAFADCPSLADIAIPSTVTDIGACAFDGCSSMTSITVDSGNTVYYSLSGVLFKNGEVFSTLVRCPEGKTGLYTTPVEVSTILDGAFRNCLVTSVHIRLTVTDIAGSAFDGCTYITEYTVDSGNSDYCSKNGAVYDKVMTRMLFYPYAYTADLNIPSSLMVFENMTLSDIHTSQFLVDTDNRIYSSQDGVLMDRHGTDLIRYPTNFIKESYTVPSSITNISSDAFWGTVYLKTLIVPAHITTEDMVLMTAYPSSIEDIIVPDGADYLAEDGMLYDRERISLLSALSTKEVINMPDTVKRVGELALTGIDADRIYFSSNLSNISPFFQYDGSIGTLKFLDHDRNQILATPDNLRGQKFIHEGDSYRMLIFRTVSFDENGGSVPVDSITADQGTTITLPGYSGTKENNEFKGWTDGTKVYQPGDEYLVGPEDVTLTAVWNENAYTVINIVVIIVIVLAFLGLVYYVRHRKLTKV